MSTKFLTSDEQKSALINCKVTKSFNNAETTINDTSIQSDNSSEHTISNLIHELNNILIKHGDIPVIYWRQNMMHRMGGFYADFTEFHKINNIHNVPTLTFNM
jgi:hypothetical protein